MQRQRIPAESFRIRGLPDFLHAQDITLEVRPTELRRSLVILRIGRQAVAAQNPLTTGRDPRRDLSGDKVGPPAGPE